MTEPEKQIIKVIREEAERVGYGKLAIDMTIHKGKVTNIQAEHVRRSENINYDKKNKTVGVD